MRPTYLDAAGMTRVDPEFLPSSLRDELRELLPRDIPMGRADAFLKASAEAAQFAHRWDGKVAAATRAKELREVEVRCHALLIALRGLSEDAASELHHVAVEDLTAADPRNSDGLKVVLLGGGRAVVNERLGTLWNLAESTEAAAGRALADLSGSKQSRPSIAAARMLAYDLARAHLDAFGRWPPIGDGWFQEVVARLGEFSQLSCGAKLVNGVLRNRRPQLTCPLPAMPS